MTMECYWHWCPYHEKDEPFCHEDKCHATAEQRRTWTHLRCRELLRNSDAGLPAPYTCGDCVNFHRCEWLVGAKRESVCCDWVPIRFFNKAPSGGVNT